VSSVNDFLAFCVDNPGRFHLLQCTVPAFTPSLESFEASAQSLQIMLDRAATAGIQNAADVNLLRALINGLASEQIANKPGGRRFICQGERAVTLLLDSIATATATTTKPAAPRAAGVAQAGPQDLTHTAQRHHQPPRRHAMAITGLHRAMLTVSDL
jgi:hypothetical protein